MHTQRTESTQPLRLPTSDDLAGVDTRTLSRQAVWVNEVFESTRRSYEAASQALGTMLTEQVARAVLEVHPAAAYLVVRPAADFHTASESDCPGHEPRLVPTAVLGAGHEEIGTISALSPIFYWLERMSPLTSREQMTLDLLTRAWVFSDAPTSSAGC